jgi:hypothetical protein
MAVYSKENCESNSVTKANTQISIKKIGFLAPQRSVTDHLPLGYTPRSNKVDWLVISNQPISEVKLDSGGS